MEIYKTTNADLANRYSTLDYMPLDIDFADYFPANSVVGSNDETIEIYMTNLV